MRMRRERLSADMISDNRKGGGWLLASILLASFPVFFVYGYNDDFHHLLRVIDGDFPWFENEWTAGGRPLGGLLTLLGFWGAGSVQGLALLRVLAALGLASWALVVYGLLRRSGIQAQTAWAASIVAVVNPGATVWAGWASCYAYSWAACAATLAGYHLVAEVGLWKRAFWLAILAASLLIYQPSAMAVFLGISITWMGSPAADGHPGTNRLKGTLFAVSTTIFVLGVLYFLTASFFAVAGSGDWRGTLAQDWTVPFLRIRDYLFVGLFSWGGLFAGPWPWLVASVSALGFVLGVFSFRVTGRQGFSNRAIRAIVLLCLVVLSLGPVLVLSADQFAYRMLAPFFATVHLISFLGWQAFLPAERRDFFSRGLSVMILSLYAYVLYDGMARPSVREYQFVRGGLAGMGEEVGSQDEVLVVVGPRFERPSGGIRPHAEFKALSLSLPWVTAAFVEMALRDVRRSLEGVPLVDSSPVVVWGGPGEGGFAHLNAVRFVYGPPLETVDHPLFGEVQVYGDGWIVSHRFGAMDLSRFPTVFHGEFGWLWFRQDGPAGLITFIEWRIGWLQTSEETFPVLQVLSPPVERFPYSGFFPQFSHVRIDRRIARGNHFISLDDSAALRTYP